MSFFATYKEWNIIGERKSDACASFAKIMAHAYLTDTTLGGPLGQLANRCLHHAEVVLAELGEQIRFPDGHSSAPTGAHLAKRHSQIKSSSARIRKPLCNASA